MISIQVSDSLVEALPLADLSRLERAAAQALAQASTPDPAGLTVVVSDDAHLRQLNRQYLQVDAPTDVLSFPADELDPDSGERYLGDVLISLPRAALQAEAAGHPLLDELQLLVVHGVLHLLGFDHTEPGEKDRMWRIQAEVLDGLGLNIKP